MLQKKLFLTSLYPSSSGTIWISTLLILLLCLFVCLSSKQAGDKQAASCWLDLGGRLDLYELKNCLLLSLSHAGYKPKKADSFWASFTGSPHSRIVTMQAGNCLMIRPAVLLPTPWQPGPHQLLTKHTSAPGHPWSIAPGNWKIVRWEEKVQKAVQILMKLVQF